MHSARSWQADLAHLRSQVPGESCGEPQLLTTAVTPLLPAHLPSCFTAITAVRLVNGPSPNAGRLEVRMGGYWGTVLYSDHPNAAQVSPPVPSWLAAMPQLSCSRYAYGPVAARFADHLCEPLRTHAVRWLHRCPPVVPVLACRSCAASWARRAARAAEMRTMGRASWA